MNTLLGIMHGRIIELKSDPGLVEGQEVEVNLRPIELGAEWGEGLRSCAGILGEHPEDDQILADIQNARKLRSNREFVD